MPITQDEFDAGGEQAARILDFLRAHASQAYTFGELASELQATDITLDDLDYALRILVEDRLIEAKSRDEKVYYLYRPFSSD